jgi:hypothetical protein
MQGFYAEPNPALRCVRHELGEAAGNDRSRGGQVARARWETADHKYEHFGSQRGRFVDSPSVFLDCAVARKKAASAKARNA